MTDYHADEMAFHSEEYRVAFGETDAAGVVFYPNYYRWFDRMTHELFRAADRSLNEHGLTGEGPVLLETHCRFLAPLRYDDLVRLEARVTDVRERTFRVDHCVRRHGGLTAEGYEIRIWVRLDGERLEPMALPKAVGLALRNRKR